LRKSSVFTLKLKIGINSMNEEDYNKSMAIMDHMEKLCDEMQALNDAYMD
jgi:hypothetical protein